MQIQFDPECNGQRSGHFVCDTDGKASPPGDAMMVQVKHLIVAWGNRPASCAEHIPCGLYESHIMRWQLEEHLSTDTYQHLLRIAETLTISEGEILIREGGRHRTLYVLESGSLGVSQKTDDGEQQLGTIESGDVVGEIAFIDQRPRSATVTVLQPSQLLKFDYATVMEALVDHPDALVDLLQALAARVTQRLRDQIPRQNGESRFFKDSSVSGTPAGMDKTGDSYLEDLVQEALSHSGVCHPYLTDLSEGNLPDLKWAICDFAVQYPGYCAHFPRYLTMVISKLDSPEHRMTLMQNLIEESGTLDDDEIQVLTEYGIDPDWVQGIPHPKLFQRFQHAMGVLESHEYTEDLLEVVCWRESFYHLLSNGSAAEAVGAIGLGTENVVNKIYTPIIRAIKRLGTIDRRDSVFFELHCEVDEDHHEALLKIARDFVDIPQNRLDLRKGMLKALGLRSIFWDWMHNRARQAGVRS
ncbi:MAG: iron-containing redox enzyme family protein [Phycisphaerae bacterium]|nr:iron-containing redox enzyme family protein [Phycisphaerae bacterium]